MALSDWTLYRVDYEDGIAVHTHALDVAMAVEKADRMRVEHQPHLFQNVPAVEKVEVVR